MSGRREIHLEVCNAFAHGDGVTFQVAAKGERPGGPVLTISVDAAGASVDSTSTREPWLLAVTGADPGTDGATDERGGA